VFRQPVGLEDADPDRVEELLDLPGERCSTGDRRAESSAEARPDLREDEPVGDPELRRERPRDRQSCGLARADLPADADRPVGEATLRARRLVECADDRSVDLLVDAWNARKHRRAERRQRVGSLEWVRQEGRGVADVRPCEVHQATEVVGQGEIQQHQVVAVEVARKSVDNGDHRVVVAVPDHAALRWAGRARRVDEREQVVLVNRGDCFVERRRTLRLECCALRFECGEIGERPDVPEQGQRVAFRFDLLRLGCVLAEDADRLRVGEDVGHIRRRAVRVDPCANGSDVCQREVEQRPFERRPGQGGEGVALFDTPCKESVREVLDPFGGLRPADVVPVVAVLDEVRGTLAIVRDGVAPETGDRAVALHGSQSTRNACRNGRIGAE